MDERRCHAGRTEAVVKQNVRVSALIESLDVTRVKQLIPAPGRLDPLAKPQPLGLVLPGPLEPLLRRRVGRESLGRSLGLAGAMDERLPGVVEACGEHVHR